MTKDEALKLSLEALKQIDEAMPFPVAKLAQKAIKEALAQPEQEPVGDFYITKDMAEHIKKLEVDWTICASGSKRPTEKKVVPVFVGNTTPPQPWEKFCDSNCVWTDHHPDCKLAERLPLTDEEIRRIELTVHGYTRQPLDVKAFARAIEAAHGIKGEA